MNHVLEDDGACGNCGLLDRDWNDHCRCCCLDGDPRNCMATATSDTVPGDQKLASIARKGAE